MKKFTGIMPALITPFCEDGKTVNETAARGLTEHLLEQGADGFYVLGSTGEGLLMTEDERKRMCEIVIDQVKGRKPVICHIAAMNFDEAVRLAKHAEQAGAAAVSAIPPLFFGYTEKEIYDYYKQLAQSTGLPFIMYNHSAANGGLSAKSVARMFEIDNITGVKWTVNSYQEVMKLKDMTQGEINIINGPDDMLISGLSAGVDAGIGTTYNVMLPEYIKIYRHFKEGNLKAALEIQIKVNRVAGCISANRLIPSVKAMCTMMGFAAGNASFPMKQMTEGDYIEKLKKELEIVGWSISGEVFD